MFTKMASYSLSLVFMLAIVICVPTNPEYRSTYKRFLKDTSPKFILKTVLQEILDEAYFRTYRQSSDTSCEAENRRLEKIFKEASEEVDIVKVKVKTAEKNLDTAKKNLEGAQKHYTRKKEVATKANSEYNEQKGEVDTAKSEADKPKEDLKASETTKEATDNVTEAADKFSEAAKAVSEAQNNSKSPPDANEQKAIDEAMYRCYFRSMGHQFDVNTVD